MTKPLIGITPIWDDEKNGIRMDQDYLTAIELVGGIPIILPLSVEKNVIKQLASSLDGLLLSGGHDIHPKYYHEEKQTGCGVTCEARDQFDFLILEEFLKLDKPVFGICRGCQLLNCYFSGDLYQDVPSELKSEHPCTHRQQPPYDIPIHHVYLKSGGKLEQILNESQLAVNSRHHQGIRQVGACLQVEAIAEDGLIEAVLHPNYQFVCGVQWHPESMVLGDNSALKLFEAFLSFCRE